EQQYEPHDLFAGLRSAWHFGRNTRDASEERLFDVGDETFEHTRLAGEVTIERRFRNTYFFREGCGCNTTTWLFLQHGRQRLQNLFAALTFHARHQASPC